MSELPTPTHPWTAEVRSTTNGPGRPDWEVTLYAPGEHHTITLFDGGLSEWLARQINMSLANETAIAELKRQVAAGDSDDYRKGYNAGYYKGSTERGASHNPDRPHRSAMPTDTPGEWRMMGYEVQGLDETWERDTGGGWYNKFHANATETAVYVVRRVRSTEWVHWTLALRDQRPLMHPDGDAITSFAAHPEAQTSRSPIGIMLASCDDDDDRCVHPDVEGMVEVLGGVA